MVINDAFRRQHYERVSFVEQTLKFAKSNSVGCTLLIGAGCSKGAGIPLASEVVSDIRRQIPEAYNKAKDNADLVNMAKVLRQEFPDVYGRAKADYEKLRSETNHGGNGFADLFEIVNRVKKGSPETYSEAIAKFDEAYKDLPPTYSLCMAQLTKSWRRLLFNSYVNNIKVNLAHLCIASMMKAGYVDRILTTNFDSLIVQACALLGEFPAVYDFAASQMLSPEDIPSKAVFHLHGQQTGFVLLNTEDELRRHSALLRPLLQDSMRRRMMIVVGYSGENDPVFEHLVEEQPLEHPLFWIGYKNELPAQHVLERLLIKRESAYFIEKYDADGFFEELTKQLGIYPPELIQRPFSHLETILGRLKVMDGTVNTAQQWVNIAKVQFESPRSVVLRTGYAPQSPPLIAQHQQVIEDFQNLIGPMEVRGGRVNPVNKERLSRAYLILGDQFTSQADQKQGAEAGEFFSRAVSSYQRALNEEPSLYEASNNWGVALFKQARKVAGVDAESLYQQAIEHYHAAIASNPEASEAYNNWGVALYERARACAVGDQKVHLLKQAIDQFQKALKHKPSSVEPLNNWGNALLEWASVTPQDEAQEILKSAARQFNAALELKPDQLDIINNLGAVYLYDEMIKYEQSLGADDDDENYLDVLANPESDQINTTAARAEAIKPGGGAYIHARRWAIHGEKIDCEFELRKAYRSKALPSKDYIMSDPYMENVRHTEWFEEFIKTAYGETI